MESRPALKGLRSIRAEKSGSGATDEGHHERMCEHMRTIDTGTLESIGGEGAGPWKMADGRLLRALSGSRPIPTEEEARAMLKTYRAAAAAAGTPQAHEVVRIAGGYGVVVDFVAGIGLGVHVAIGSYSAEEAGREMGVLLHGLHGARMGEGRDWNKAFRFWTRALAPHLPNGMGEALVPLVDGIASRDCLLHGDFHVGNVVVCGGSLALIDMESAGFGHPAFDLAVSRSRMLGNASAEARHRGMDSRKVQRTARAIWDGFLMGYFDGAGTRELEVLDRGLTVLSEVERCCYTYDVVHASAAGLQQNQRERVSLCVRRLAQLLPEVERLDF